MGTKVRNPGITSFRDGMKSESGENCTHGFMFERQALCPFELQRTPRQLGDRPCEAPGGAKPQGKRPEKASEPQS